MENFSSIYPEMILNKKTTALSWAVLPPKKVMKVRIFQTEYISNSPCTGCLAQVDQVRIQLWFCFFSWKVNGTKELDQKARSESASPGVEMSPAPSASNASMPNLAAVKEMEEGEGSERDGDKLTIREHCDSDGDITGGSDDCQDGRCIV